MRLLILISFLIAPFFFARAQDSEGWRNQPQKKKGEIVRNSIQTGWMGYLGLTTGYVPRNSNLDVEGTPSSVKLLGSYVSSDSIGVFDLGYGIQMQSFVTNSGGERQIANPVIEVAARFQFENRWQFGIIYNSFYNQGVRFGANQADVHFVGF